MPTLTPTLPEERTENCNFCEQLTECSQHLGYWVCKKCAYTVRQCFACGRFTTKFNLIRAVPFRREYSLCNNCLKHWSQCVICSLWFTGGGNTCLGCKDFEKFSHVSLFEDYESSLDYLPNRYFSIELEVIRKLNFPSLPPMWISTYDGSLSRSGIEILNRIPLKGRVAIDEISNLYSTIKRTCTTNSTCGYHLHIDCTKESEDTIAKFAQFCIQIQDSLLGVVKEHRRNQFECKMRRNYCTRLPPYNSASLEDYVYKQLSPDPSNSRPRYGHKYHLARYYWWNFHSYFYRKTIECRIHHGTIMPDVILRWAELWLKVFDFIKHNPQSEYSTDTNILVTASKAGVRKPTINFYKRKQAQFENKNNLSVVAATTEMPF